MDRSNDLIFLFIVTACVFCCPVAKASMVGTDPIAEGWKGEDIRLPCIFHEEPFAVYWSKENRSEPDQLTNKATYFNGEFSSKEKRFVIDTSFNLVITDLEVADEGNYHCQVVLESFQDFSNSTSLTINAKATEHIIEQCVGQVRNSNSCTIQTWREAPTFHLDCRVTGFRPNVSLMWSKSGRVLPPLWSDQYTLSDGTFERLETITVTANDNTDQDFKCTASGLSVEGTSAKVITVLSLHDVPGPNKIALGISLTLLFVVLITVLFFATGKLLQIYKPELIPDGLSRIPGWKKPLIDPRSKGMHLSNNIEKSFEEREKLRARISDYQPGKASGCDLGNLKRVNINLFGQMSAGKSAFINSIFFALKGTYENVAVEGSVESGGGQTKQRTHHPLTEFISVQDNRGMQSFDVGELKGIKEEIRGCRSMDAQHKILKDKSQECHAAVLVYHKTEMGQQEAHKFIYQFFEEVKTIHVTSPLLVITHGDEYPDSNAVLQSVQHIVDNKNRVLLLANYTEDNHKEDIDKDIQLLQFLWTILRTSDQNAYNLEFKNQEIIIEEPKPVKKQPPRNKKPDPDPEPPKPRDEKWCSVM
ncbi:uncharacterized protein [Diadema antillarum]|uniref:uncharacterized protein n=1 Tax=Diadema antillarum TaxID=105358 RepID=UPI003A863773